jgi:regulator of replication initiation timing
MEPPDDLEQMYAAALAEQAALQRKVRTLEHENAALKFRRVQLELRLAQAAAKSQESPRVAGPAQSSNPGGSD